MPGITPATHTLVEEFLVAATDTAKTAVAAEATKTDEVLANDAGISEEDLAALLEQDRWPLEMLVQVGAALTEPLVLGFAAEE